MQQRFDDPGEGVAVAKNSAFAEEFAFNIRTIFTSVESKIGQFLSARTLALTSGSWCLRLWNNVLFFGFFR